MKRRNFIKSTSYSLGLAGLAHLVSTPGMATETSQECKSFCRPPENSGGSPDEGQQSQYSGPAQFTYDPLFNPDIIQFWYNTDTFTDAKGKAQPVDLDWVVRLCGTDVQNFSGCSFGLRLYGKKRTKVKPPAQENPWGPEEELATTTLKTVSVANGDKCPPNVNGKIGAVMDSTNAGSHLHHSTYNTLPNQEYSGLRVALVCTTDLGYD